MNPGPNEPLELPDLFEAIADRAQLANRLRQLARDTEVESVRMRGRADGVSLALVETALQRGCLQAVQIRYRSAGQLWVETVMRSAGAFKIVRMESTG